MPRYGQSVATVTRLLTLLAVAMALPSQATVYPLVNPNDTVVGQDQTVTTVYEDTLYDLARTYSLGSEELIRVNPSVDPWLPGAGKQLVIPGRHILPAGPREGIVVNLPEHRLYYYPKPARGKPAEVITYPVSIGKMDWHTPIGLTHVIAKIKNPAWYPPESVRKEHAAAGDPLPTVVPRRPGQSAGRLCHAAGRRRRHLHDPWHQQSHCRGTCGHAWLHPHVSQRRGGVISDDSSRHAGTHRQ